MLLGTVEQTRPTPVLSVVRVVHRPVWCARAVLLGPSTRCESAASSESSAEPVDKSCRDPDRTYPQCKAEF